MRRITRSRGALGIVLVGVVLATDHLLADVRGRLLATALIDELGHLATGLLVIGALAAVGRGVGCSRYLGAGVLIGSAAIDIDHFPRAVLGSDVVTTGTPRPWTHSCLTLVVLVAVAIAVPARGRPAWSMLSAGLALGVLFHLVRDMAVPAGVGVSILWPASDRPWQISEHVYLAILCLLVVSTYLRPAIRLRRSA